MLQVIQAIPNAIGALCLNPVGQEQLAARPTIIPALLSIFTSDSHQRILQEKEHSALVGSAIEELIRHHPSLKDTVFDAIKATMIKIEELGNSFTVPDDIKPFYVLQPVKPSSTPSRPDPDVEMAPNEPREAPAESHATNVVDNDTAKDYLEDDKSHDNVVISYIDVFCKVSVEFHILGRQG